MHHYNHTWWVWPNKQPRRTPQCSVRLCELALTVRRSAALHTRWLCINLGLGMMRRSVPDRKSAADSVQPCSASTVHAQCTQCWEQILSEFTVFQKHFLSAVLYVMMFWFIRISVAVFILLLVSDIFGFVETKGLLHESNNTEVSNAVIREMVAKLKGIKVQGDFLKNSPFCLYLSLTNWWQWYNSDSRINSNSISKHLHKTNSDF